ncbi:MAG: helix-turn-helix domain-containing protein [Bacteroidales bacterium]|nr:helix-turn-helix domain-containing protein [Bacteroidales bacterium]
MVDFKKILHRDVRDPGSVIAAGDDFFILDNPEFISTGRFPYKNDWLIATLCVSGSASGIINLREYRVEPGGFIIILPGQVIVRSALSDDFRGKILLMSKRFSDSLDIGRTLTITASIEQRPYYQFEGETIGVVFSYLSSCEAMIRLNGGNPVVWDVLRLLARAFFLGAGPLLKKRGGTSPTKTYGKLTEDFLALVEKQYREHRQLDYYAGELGRSPKYLSRRIKEETGQNATDWIDRCVILDAEAQLLSTKKTVLEVSDSLGFPSQSFFGKYFKRVTGLSPKEFRRSRADL